MKSSREFIGLIILAAISQGCETAAPGSPASKSIAPSPIATRITVTAHPPMADDARDAQPQLGAMVHLDIYLLEMPIGSVSKNQEFWKRVDEQVISIADLDRLNRNGLRCGTVQRSESGYFSRFFDSVSHHTVINVVDDLHSDTVKLDAGGKFDQQDLFFFDEQNQLQGRSYDAGVNELSLAFSPAPRMPGSVRLDLCPIVRSEKKRMQFTTLNDEYQTVGYEVDRLYQASMQADVADDSFFVLAPSSDAARKTSVGGTFLIKSDQTQQMEIVVLVMPTFIRTDGKPVTLPDLLTAPTPTTKPTRNLFR